MNMFDLSGRVAMVTGGNGGIGLAMARGLAGAGAEVVITGRDGDKNQAAVLALGGTAGAIQVDLLADGAGAAAVAETRSRHGRLDILVNNAGINIRKPPQDYSPAEWHGVLETNLTAAFRCAQAAYAAMRAGGGGKIINIGSMLSIFGASFAVAYAASKGGIVQMSKSLACAWAKDNIQVNVILPGMIDTDMTRQSRVDVPGLDKMVRNRTPAGRWGRPEDVAGTAVFLASHASDFVTGAVIAVDGGFSSQA